jgi:hypothetical protein
MHTRSHGDLRVLQHRPQKKLGILAILFPAQNIPKTLTDNLRRQAHGADRSGHSGNHVPGSIRLSPACLSPRSRSFTHTTTGTCKTPSPTEPPCHQTPVSDPRLPGPGRWKAPAVAREIQRGRGSGGRVERRQQRQRRGRWGLREVKSWADEDTRERR